MGICLQLSKRITVHNGHTYVLLNTIFRNQDYYKWAFYVFIGGATLHEEVVAVEAAAGITGDKPPPAKSELSYVLLLKG